MGGVCPMNNRLKEWIDSSIAQRSDCVDTSQHVDWFLGKSVKKNCDATLAPSVSLYLEAIDYLSSRGLDSAFMARLYIPFTWTDGILFHDGHYYYEEIQPPSLYITSRIFFLKRFRGEFYQKTIPAFDSRLNSESFHTYYLCELFHKNERFYDCDYLRAVFVEHIIDFKQIKVGPITM